MKLDVQSRSVEVTTQTQELIERRLAFALGRFGPAVTRIRVSLSDDNGPRGGHDKTCLIEAKLRSVSDPIVVEVTDDQIEAAVSRAAERLARRVNDELGRQRDLRRRPRGENETGRIRGMHTTAARGG